MSKYYNSNNLIMLNGNKFDNTDLIDNEIFIDHDDKTVFTVFKNNDPYLRALICKGIIKDYRLLTNSIIAVSFIVSFMINYFIVITNFEHNEKIANIIITISLSLLFSILSNIVGKYYIKKKSLENIVYDKPVTNYKRLYDNQVLINEYAPEFLDNWAESIKDCYFNKSSKSREYADIIYDLAYKRKERMKKINQSIHHNAMDKNISIIKELIEIEEKTIM